MRRKTKKIGLVILAVIACLVVLRLCLAFIILTVCNHELENLKGYKGHIDHVSLSLWRGAYQFNGLAIVRESGSLPVPFFSAAQTDIGLHWGALFHGSFVAQVRFYEPELNFVQGPKEESSQTGKGQNWADAMTALVPIRINRLVINNGSIHFRNPYSSPQVDVHMDDLECLAENLNNSRRDRAVMHATVSATAKVMGQAGFGLSGRLAPFAAQPTFELAAKLENLDLGRINQFLVHYAGFDVRKGRLSLYSEVSAGEGRYSGYVKPLVTELEVKPPQEKKSVGQFVKQSLAALVAWIFKNRPKNQQATRVEFAGSFKDSKVDVWKAIRYLFENAFIQALPPGFESEPGGKK